MGESDYSFSLTTFSPSGRLVQIEYALNAVTAGATALGIKGMCRINSPKFHMTAANEGDSLIKNKMPSQKDCHSLLTEETLHRI